MTSKPGRVVTLGLMLKASAYCQRGVRREGGVSPFLARVWNLGTCRLDAKGVAQVEDPQGLEYQCEAQGRITS
jgi:hypothetical protein